MWRGPLPREAWKSPQPQNRYLDRPGTWRGIESYNTRIGTWGDMVPGGASKPPPHQDRHLERHGTWRGIETTSTPGSAPGEAWYKGGKRKTATRINTWRGAAPTKAQTLTSTTGFHLEMHGTWRSSKSHLDAQIGTWRGLVPGRQNERLHNRIWMRSVLGAAFMESCRKS